MLLVITRYLSFRSPARLLTLTPTRAAGALAGVLVLRERERGVQINQQRAIRTTTTASQMPPGTALEITTVVVLE